MKSSDDSKPVKDRLSEKIVEFINENPNSSNFDLEEKFGKASLSHVDELVEQGVLEEKELI